MGERMPRRVDSVQGSEFNVELEPETLNSVGPETLATLQDRSPAIDQFSDTSISTPSGSDI